MFYLSGVLLPDPEKEPQDDIQDGVSSSSATGKKIEEVDYILDSMISRMTGTYEKSLSKLGEYGPKIKEQAKLFAKIAGEKKRIWDEKSELYSDKLRRFSIVTAFSNLIIHNPKKIITIVVIISMVIGFFGVIGFPPPESGKLKIQEQIRSDLEVYLPQDHETFTILQEVREDYTTDILILYLETANKYNPINDENPVNDRTNITDFEILKMISAIEEEINPFKDDRGQNDSIMFVMSFSVLIKTINVSAQYFTNALADEFDLPHPAGIPGEYAIPNNQDLIDMVYNSMPPDKRQQFLVDANNDTIADTGVVLIGMAKGEAQEVFLEEIDGIVAKHVDEERLTVTVTGPVAMFDRLSARTYLEFQKVLPVCVLLIAAVLIIFHRTWKILIIVAIPVGTSLAITFGVIGLAGMILVPQVILVAPLLIALGVAYGLYIANRYAEEKHIPGREDRIRYAMRTTGKPIFLSAATTSIGFGSLMTVNMVPLRVMGFGLSFGIMVCYFTTILTVPSIVMWLNYQKKGEIKGVQRLGDVPIRNRKKILAAVIIISLISGGIILTGGVVVNMDYVEMSPPDEPALKTMGKYSDEFNSGQVGLILIRGFPAVEKNVGRFERDKEEVEGSMKDFDVLKQIERMEGLVNEVDRTDCLGIVDILKMIRLPSSEEGGPVLQVLYEQTGLEEYTNTSFWSVLGRLESQPPSQERLLRIFYNTIPVELRGMLVNADYSNTVLWIFQPTMDTTWTKQVVQEVNKIADEYPAGKSTSHLTGFAAIVVAVNDLLLVSSLTSTAYALLLVLVILIIVFRSIKYSILTLIPVTLVVSWQPVVLTVIGVELNLFTALIGSIIVGIGIDFGIHMTERVREGGGTLDSVRNGVRTSGWSFLEATITMVVGFSSVYMVDIQVFKDFISEVNMLLIASALGAMMVLPAIYGIVIIRRQRRVLKPITEESIVVEPLPD